MTASPAKPKKAAAAKDRTRATSKAKAASLNRGKATITSAPARSARARRAVVEVEEGKDEEAEDDDGEGDDSGLDFEGTENATPSRLTHGPVNRSAVWRLERSASAATGKPKSGRTAAAGKAGKTTTRSRSKAAQYEHEVAEDEDTTSHNIHTLSLTELQSLLAHWTAGSSVNSSPSILDTVADSAESLIPSYSERIASSTSALADIVSTLSEAVLAVQSELAVKRKAADARVKRWAGFALWHHERVVRLAERLERELERVGGVGDVGKGGKGKESAIGRDELAGAARLVAKIRDWSDDGAVRCAEACQREKGPCEECGREAPVVEKEKEESLPDYEDDEEEEVVIVVEQEGNVLQRYQVEEDEGQRSADSYGITHGHLPLPVPLPSTLPASTAEIRPASARSNSAHRPTAINTASLTYTQPKPAQALPALPPSQLRPASTGSDPALPLHPHPSGSSALSALSALISPPSSSQSTDGDDTPDDHLYDDLFESEAPLAALSGPLQAAAVTFPAIPSIVATSPLYQPARPLHPGPAHLNATSPAYQHAQPQHPQYAQLHPGHNDEPVGTSEKLLNAPYDDSSVDVTPPPDRREMEVTYEYQGSFHGVDQYGANHKGEGSPSFSPVASPE